MLGMHDDQRLKGVGRHSDNGDDGIIGHYGLAYMRWERECE